MKIDRLTLMDLYTDYQICSFDKIEMTKLSAMINKKYSHDVFTKLLSTPVNTEDTLTKKAKSLINEISKKYKLLLIADDTLLKKPYSNENNIIAHFYDNSEKKITKGINLLNFVVTPMSNFDKTIVPVAFEVIQKNVIYQNKYFQTKRKSEYTKNELFRDKLEYLVKYKKINFEYILGDSWFASNENINYINKINQKFFFRIKNNRLFAYSNEDKIKGNFSKISEINKSFSDCVIYLKGCDTPIRWLDYMSKTARKILNILIL